MTALPLSPLQALADSLHGLDNRIQVHPDEVASLRAEWARSLVDRLAARGFAVTEYAERSDDLAELQRLASIVEWGGGDGPWDYLPDVAPGTAYAQWVRMVSPTLVLNLLARIPDVVPSAVGGTDG